MTAAAETVTLEQQEALIEFLEHHRELALGRFSRTKEGRSLSKRLWVECANLLNSVSANCPTRKVEAWRTYFADYKSKLLKKIKKNKQALSETGGEMYSQAALTSLQERLYDILERDVSEPITGVHHDPLDVTLKTEDGDGGAEINILEVSWDRVDTPTTTAAMATTTTATPTTTAATRTESRRRRRRSRSHSRSRSRSRSCRHLHREQEPEMTPFESPEQRLAAMKSRSADATFALAQAINRLADALDGHSRRLLQDQPRRCGRRHVSRRSSERE